MYSGSTWYCNYNIVIVRCHQILHSWTGLSVRVRMMFRLEFQYWKIQYNSHLPQYFIFITFSSFNIQCQYNNMLGFFFISNTDHSTLECNTCSYFHTSRPVERYSTSVYIFSSQRLLYLYKYLNVFVIVFICFDFCTDNVDWHSLYCRSINALIVTREDATQQSQLCPIFSINI